MTSPRISIAPRVSAATAEGQPVVALETTLITHGFSRADGLEVARHLESIVSSTGAMPATIGVLEGRLRVGLEPDELARLAAEAEVQKLNPSNLAAGLASGRPGSTTVAATIATARLAGIQVMATGGIGGVHRDVADSGDVSADLTTLGRCQVAVVCAGAKAILDLPRTLEALETLGVPVLGVRTDRFPAFYRRDSGLPVDQRFDSIAELATAVRIHFGLGIGSGIVVANPIPERFELAETAYDSAISQSLQEVHDRGLQGRSVTPYLLARLDALTAGLSGAANRGLLAHNAEVAARLAVTLAQPAAD